MKEFKGYRAVISCCVHQTFTETTRTAREVLHGESSKPPGKCPLSSVSFCLSSVGQHAVHNTYKL